MKYLRQSTAATVAVGPFLAKADGLTPVTSLTSSSALNGRGVSNGTGAAYAPATFAHDANGYYLAPLAIDDVPSVGRLRLEFSDPATYYPVWEDFTVIPAPVYDGLFGVTLGLPASVAAYAGGQDPGTLCWAAATRTLTAFGFSVTAATVGDKTGYGLAANSITSSTFSVSTVNAAATGILERLMLLVGRFFPLSGGSVTAPKSGNGSIVVKTTGGTTIATQAASDDGTTQTLGAAS